MTPDQLSDVIVAALNDLNRQGRLELSDDLPTQVVVERPKVREHGDYATNIALQLAKKAGRKPRELAQDLAEALEQVDGISSAEVAGPGFLNLRVAAGAQGAVAADIVAQGPAYGSSSDLAGRRINVEFVSANPTGPIHLGGTRWAAAGDSLARVFSFAGADVTREYYFNDHGGQIDRFAASLHAAAHGQEPPEDGYVGAYITEIATAVIEQEPDVLKQEQDVATETFRRLGVEMMFAQIKTELHDFGVDFDVYFHENTLHETGAVDHAIDRLKDLGMMYESDGAWWLRTTDFGDDKDRVVIRSNGSPAYLSGDLAYYLNKRERGFDLVVIMLGADHHGYVGRMMAMCQAFGDKPHENLEIPIGQMVNLVRDGQPLRMSKRSGTVVTMTDLVDAVGVDAARYALVRYSADSPIDIDLALWSSRTSDNPVFYVQYAHARMSSILRTAEAAGLAPATPETFDPSLLSHEREGLLLGALAEFPRVIGKAVEWREPHRIARYLEETAGSFHRFYDACRVLPREDEQPSDLHRARLLLLSATRQVLSNGLGLLGVSAPDRM